MYNFEKGTVVTVVTTAGEFVGKFNAADESSVCISDPRMLVPSGNGLGFGPTVCMTAKREIEHVKFNLAVVAFVTETDESIAKIFVQQTSGILL